MKPVGRHSARTQASGCDVGPGRRHPNCFHGGSKSLHFGPALELALQIPQKTHYRCVGQGTSLSRHAGADSGQTAQALRPCARFADEPGLADSRLATDEDRGPRRLTNGFEAGCELGELRLPSDQFERSEPAHHEEIVALSAFECLGSCAGEWTVRRGPSSALPRGVLSAPCRAEVTHLLADPADPAVRTLHLRPHCRGRARRRAGTDGHVSDDEGGREQDEDGGCSEKHPQGSPHRLNRTRC